MINLENNPKLGYYTVGEERIYIKPRALIRATETGHFPEWNFNRDVFDPYPWDQEPETALKELYRIRAQQLRDRYDYTDAMLNNSLFSIYMIKNGMNVYKGKSTRDIICLELTL